MRIVVASVAGHPAPVTSLIDLAVGSFESAGTEVTRLEVPSRGLPEGDEEGAKLAASFSATPGSLIESWRVARHLEAATAPGDVVVVPDHRGVGGIFALTQATLAPSRRRIVWTLAGSSLTLGLLGTVGTVEGAATEDEAAIDWELVQYRESADVLAIGEAPAHLLGTEATVTFLPVVARMSAPVGDGPVIGLPEPVSRRSQTFPVVRGLHTVLERDPEIRVVVSEEDHQDEVWTGTTWDTMAAVVESFDGRITRGDALGAHTLILGERFFSPAAPVVEAADRGTPLVVPEGSTAAALFPDAPTWTDEDSLARVLFEAPTEAPGPVRRVPEVRPIPSADRAWRISVGIAVYRDVRFLDDCLRSVFSQTQLPHEVVLHDDGSRSAAVSQAFRRWEKAEPDRIRTMRGPHRGMCAARNALIGSMTGDAFVLVDGDALLEPSCLERCAEALRWNPHLWAVATWARFAGNGDTVEGGPPFDRRVGVRENSIVSAAVLVDMSIRDLGIQFAPDLAFLDGEDWHFWSQIVAAGGRIGLVPEPLVVRREPGASDRTALARRVGKARAAAPLLGAGPS